MQPIKPLRLKLRTPLNAMYQQLNRINTRMRRIADHPNMSSEAKFRRSARETREINKIGRRFERMLERLE